MNGHLTRVKAVLRIAGLAALAAAISTSSAAPAASEAPRVVDCQTRLQVIPRNDHPPLRGPGYVAAGPVTFTAWFTDVPAGQLKRIKAPIFVDAGQQVTISLSDASARRAEIRIGLDQGGEVRGPSVGLSPCPPDATVAGRRVGRYTPFLGGFKVDGPMCMRVTVVVDGTGESFQRRLPVSRNGCR